MPLRRALTESCAPLLLVLLLQLFVFQSPLAFSPLDSVTQNVAINATLSNLDLASSQTSFVPTRTPVIRLDWLWVSCGLDNRGPVASIRVYLSLASDAVVVYFEFVSVHGGWRGVARGRVDYPTRSFTANLDPFGASRTGVSVHYADDLVTAAGGGFNSVVRIWAEGSRIRVYAGECQYGIGFQSAETSPDYQLIVVAGIVSGLVALLCLAALVIMFIRRTRAVRPSMRVCGHCGFTNPPYARSFCIKCGNPLEAP